jgi:capsule polysaccharide modification protein KpsS
VGFSALSHGAPVKTCGLAIYDIAGLTFQGPLDVFWREAQDFRLDPKLLARFRAYVIDQTQINCSFYKGPIRNALCAPTAASTAARPAPVSLSSSLVAIHANE